MLTSSWREDSYLESSACEEYADFSFRVMFDDAQWRFLLELSPAPDIPRTGNDRPDFKRR